MTWSWSWSTHSRYNFQRGPISDSHKDLFSSHVTRLSLLQRALTFGDFQENMSIWFYIPLVKWNPVTRVTRQVVLDTLFILQVFDRKPRWIKLSKVRKYIRGKLDFPLRRNFSSHISLFSQMKVSFTLLLSLTALALAKDEAKKDDIGTVIGIDLGTTYSW